jgi:hypothetical protein
MGASTFRFEEARKLIECVEQPEMSVRFQAKLRMFITRRVDLVSLCFIPTLPGHGAEMLDWNRRMLYFQARHSSPLLRRTL